MLDRGCDEKVNINTRMGLDGCGLEDRIKWKGKTSAGQRKYHVHINNLSFLWLAK